MEGMFLEIEKNIIVIFFWRCYVFKYVVVEVYGFFDVNWKEVVNGINIGLWVMRRCLLFIVVDGNI